MNATDLPLCPSPQRGLPWPAPALLAWALAWAGYAGARQAGIDALWAWPLAALVGAAAAWPVAGRLRRALVAAGFPLSSLVLGAPVPAWLWLVPAATLLLAYPLRAWADAPFFPTPARALQGLAAQLPLPAGAHVLDAGCGLGHGLTGLHAAFPQARIDGVEWSALLAWCCARRCRFARVRRADMWLADWSGYDLVYLFQRPETMARAWTKACAELAPGGWLVSLAFAVPGVEPWQRLDAGGGRPLWVYRTPGQPCSDSMKPRHGR